MLLSHQKATSSENADDSIGCHSFNMKGSSWFMNLVLRTFYKSVLCDHLKLSTVSMHHLTFPACYTTYCNNTCDSMVFSDGSDGKEPACNAGDSGFDPWLRKILWRREW